MTYTYWQYASSHYLTGKTRHEGQNVEDNMTLAEHSTPCTYAPTVPKYLGDLANQACHRDVRSRPATVAEFRKALEAYFTLQEAEKLHFAGQTLLADLRTIGTNVAQKQLALSDYHKALFAFEQARRFPSHQSLADQWLAETNETMLAIAIEHKENAGGKSHL